MAKAETPPPFYNASTQRHWDYFRSLEDDFAKTDRYVQICKDNFETYSVEYTRLFIAICSEIDVCLKLLCVSVNNKFEGREMKAYRKELMKSRYKWYPEACVDMRGRFIMSMPWEEWSNGKAPDWWSAYNDVKHRRDQHFAKGNLENTIDALAGLFVVLTGLCSSVINESQVFRHPHRQ
jgi:hypothetical protein